MEKIKQGAADCDEITRLDVGLSQVKNVADWNKK